MDLPLSSILHPLPPPTPSPDPPLALFIRRHRKPRKKTPLNQQNSHPIPFILSLSYLSKGATKGLRQLIAAAIVMAGSTQPKIAP